MGNNQTNNVQQLDTQSNPHSKDKSLDWLQKTQSTVYQTIACQPEQSNFIVICPKCKAEQFDDGLGRKVNCFRCQVVFLVRDGHVEIQQELAVDERRYNSQLDTHKNQPDLDCLVLYCNGDRLPNELIENEQINYKLILSQIIVPFFSIRQRYIQPGVIFQIGQFEFKIVGSNPKCGKVSESTQLYCYDSYSSQQPVQKVVVAPLHSKRLTGEQVGVDLKNLFSIYPKQNNLINDQQFKVNNSDFLVIKTCPRQGKITSETKFECLREVPKELKDMTILCVKCPQGLCQFPTNQNMEDAIMKTVIIPYFSGMTRFVENGMKIVLPGFEFNVESPLEQGLVIPIKTKIELKIMISPNRIRTIQRQQQQQNQLHQQHQQFEEQKQQQDYRVNPHVVQRMHQQYVSINRRQRLNHIIQDVIQNHNDEEQTNQPDQIQQQQAPTINDIIFNRRSRRNSDQHLQQIEALQRLLNTFILLNETNQLHILERNQGANQAQINRLPERKISLNFLKERGLNDEDHVRCLICLIDYEDEDTVRTMPCLHYFHRECLDNWLVKNKTCPICKTLCDIQHLDEN